MVNSNMLFLTIKIILIIIMVISPIAFFVWFYMNKMTWRYRFHLHSRFDKSVQVIMAKTQRDEENSKLMWFILKDNESRPLPISDNTSTHNGKRVWDIVTLPNGDFTFLKKSTIEKEKNKFWTKYELTPIEKSLLIDGFNKGMNNHENHDKTDMITKVVSIVMLTIVILGASYTSLNLYKEGESRKASNQILSDVLKDIKPLVGDMRTIAEIQSASYNGTRVIGAT